MDCDELYQLYDPQHLTLASSSSFFSNPIKKLKKNNMQMTIYGMSSRYVMFTYYNILDSSWTEQVSAHFTFSLSIVIP